MVAVPTVRHLTPVRKARTLFDKTMDTLVIDPVKMNIVNRVAAETTLSGAFHFQGACCCRGA